MNVIFCNLCDQINGKCVDKIVSAADFAMYNSNSKCPQISSYRSMIVCVYYSCSVLYSASMRSLSVINYYISWC